MRRVAPPVDRPAIDRRTPPPGQGRGHGSPPGNGDPTAPEGSLGGRLPAQRPRGVAPVKSAVSAPPVAFAAFAAVLAAAPVVADAEPAGDPVGVPLVSPTQASQKPIQGAGCRPL